MLLGDNSVIYAYGIRKVLLNTGISMLELSNTLYVPDLGRNLISVRNVVQAQCRVIFDEPGYCDIVDKSTTRLLARGIYRQGLYELSQHSASSTTSTSAPTTTSMSAPTTTSYVSTFRFIYNIYYFFLICRSQFVASTIGSCKPYIYEKS